MPRAPQHNPAGFTLLEVIIVIALLAIMASIAVPRLVSHEGRTLQLAADGVADLLTVYAQREQLSARPVGIWHDAQRNWLVLMVLDIDPANPDEPAAWRPDRACKPLKLPASVSSDGVLVTADGSPVEIRQWPIATQPGQQRRSIEITLITNDGRTTTVELASHAMAPHHVDQASIELGERVPIDLDAAGRQREDW